MALTRGKVFDELARRATESAAYRRSLIDDPKTTVAEQFGVEIPDGLDLKVIEDTADCVHLVLPHRPQAGDELSDLDLEAIGGGNTVVKSAVGGDLIVMEASLYG